MLRVLGLGFRVRDYGLGLRLRVYGVRFTSSVQDYSLGLII